MGLRLGETAPDFEANTTEGRIRFHEWIGDSWVVLFSHPKDFTPVCTTELGYMAKLKSEFDKRNTKIIGLSVDAVDNHAKWAVDIKETQGEALNFPLLADTEKQIVEAYGVWKEKSMYGRKYMGIERTTFIIDASGKISHIFPKVKVSEHYDEVLAALKE